MDEAKKEREGREVYFEGCLIIVEPDDCFNVLRRVKSAIFENELKLN